MIDTLNSLSPFQSPSDADVLRVACARALGIAARVVESDMAIFTVEREWLDKGDYYFIDEEGSTRRLPLFSTDYGAAKLLEDEIERRELWERYTDVLEEITQRNRGEYKRADDDVRWRFLRATPAQRARAFVEVTKQHG